MKRGSLKMRAGVAVTTALIGTIAHSETDAVAQAPQQTTDASKKSGTSEPAEIIVTARKKSERLVDTPISITAFPTTLVPDWAAGDLICLLGRY